MRIRVATAGLLLLALILGVLLPVSAAALGGIDLICLGVEGGCVNAGTELVDLAEGLGIYFLDAAAAVAMFFIVWGGLSMVVSAGDESKATTGRNSVVYAMIGLAVALSAQMILSVVVDLGESLPGTPQQRFEEVAKRVILIPISYLNLIFSVVIVITAFRLLLARGKSDETTTSYRMLFYAVVGAIVVNLAKAIFTAVLDIFNF